MVKTNSFWTPAKPNKNIKITKLFRYEKNPSPRHSPSNFDLKPRVPVTPVKLSIYPKRTAREIGLIDKNPWGDKDKDRVPNIFDCKPMDRKKQGWFDSKYNIDRRSKKRKESTINSSDVKKDAKKYYKGFKTLEVNARNKKENSLPPFEDSYSVYDHPLVKKAIEEEKGFGLRQKDAEWINRNWGIKDETDSKPNITPSNLSIEEQYKLLKETELPDFVRDMPGYFKFKKSGKKEKSKEGLFKDKRAMSFYPYKKKEDRKKIKGLPDMRYRQETQSTESTETLSPGEKKAITWENKKIKSELEALDNSEFDKRVKRTSEQIKEQEKEDEYFNKWHKGYQEKLAKLESEGKIPKLNKQPKKSSRIVTSLSQSQPPTISSTPEPDKGDSFYKELATKALEQAPDAVAKPEEPISEEKRRQREYIASLTGKKWDKKGGIFLGVSKLSNLFEGREKWGKEARVGRKKKEENKTKFKLSKEDAKGYKEFLKDFEEKEIKEKPTQKRPVSLVFQGNKVKINEIGKDGRGVIIDLPKKPSVIRTQKSFEEFEREDIKDFVEGIFGTGEGPKPLRKTLSFRKTIEGDLIESHKVVRDTAALRSDVATSEREIPSKLLPLTSKQKEKIKFQARDTLRRLATEAEKTQKDVEKERKLDEEWLKIEKEKDKLPTMHEKDMEGAEEVVNKRVGRWQKQAFGNDFDTGYTDEELYEEEKSNAQELIGLSDSPDEKFKEVAESIPAETKEEKESAEYEKSAQELIDEA